MNTESHPLIEIKLQELATELERTKVRAEKAEAERDQLARLLPLAEQDIDAYAAARIEASEKANAALQFAIKCALDLDTGRAASACLHAALADTNLGATIPCDDCAKPSGIYVCTGCWEKHRGQLNQGADTSTPHYDNFGDWVPRAELEAVRKKLHDLQDSSAELSYAVAIENKRHHAELRRVAEAVRSKCHEQWSGMFAMGDPGFESVDLDAIVRGACEVQND